MPAPFPIPDNEIERLQALHRYALLDTAPEPAFDRLAQVVVNLLRTPSSSRRPEAP